MQQNGSYYSADNGFACAAGGRGITEALREHLNVIVRNEELETDAVTSEIQEEIHALVDDKERLEQEKLDRQERLDELAKEQSAKEARLSELQIQINAPLNIEVEEDSHIEGLQEKIDENDLKLADTASELEPLLEDRAKIETNLEAPTQIELQPLPTEDPPVLQSTKLEKALSCFTAVALVGLIFYLFIFYASVGDRTFTIGIGTVQEKTQIIIPHALFEAWEVEDSEDKKDRRNWFVITFPFIFLTLALLAYYCHENKSWGTLGGLLLATFSIDMIIAVKISVQMHEFTHGADAPYVFSENWTEVLSVLFLGFGVALLLSYGLYWFMKVWKGVRPNEDAEARLAKLIRSEKNDRLVELNALNIHIETLQEKIRKLEQENRDYKDQIEVAFKKPIEIEIAGIQMDQTHLQNQMSGFSEQIQGLQEEINRCESEIEDLVNRRRKKFVDIKKLERQANEFVTGWCRYVAQRKTELPETISAQVSDIQELAERTLQDYVASLQNT